MSTTFSCFVWNVRGLNDRARRNVVRELLLLHKPSCVCIQETKLSSLCNLLANEILGPAFDYDFLPATGAAGGILLAWVRDDWVVSDINKGRFAISARFQKRGATSTPWWLTGVYGPQEDAQKVEFLAELRQFRDTSPGPWLICGDFNMIYRA